MERETQDERLEEYSENDHGVDREGDQMDHDLEDEIEEAVLGAPLTQPWAALIAQDEDLAK